MIQDHFGSKFLSQSGVHNMQDKPRPREKTIKQYMLENPNGKLCSRCGDEVPGARGDACVCWRCTSLLAGMKRKGYFKKEVEPKRLCPDCSGERPKGKQRCEKCTKHRRRKKQRILMRNKRSAVSKTAFANP